MQSVAEIDLVTVHCLGFPSRRGGVLHYADTLGVNAIVDHIKVWAIEDPVAWQVSPLLLQCVEQGIDIVDWSRG